jgi:ubiquinone/menaquinone biosynthesis C-methylase UbiE
VIRLNDRDLVRGEYASEGGLDGRRAAYRFATGPDARELTFEAVTEAHPQRVLEVGCGPGELAARIGAELGAEVRAVDISPRMVELARGRGVSAQVGDVQALPFDTGEFDCVVAAWMLYHVPDIDRALGELARVLRRGGRLVAVTNSEREHWRELRELLGVEAPISPFPAERAAELLAQHFVQVEARDATGWIEFPSRADAQALVDVSVVLSGRLPDFEGPLHVRRAPWIFVARR